MSNNFKIGDTVTVYTYAGGHKGTVTGVCGLTVDVRLDSTGIEVVAHCIQCRKLTKRKKGNK